MQTSYSVQLSVKKDFINFWTDSQGVCIPCNPCYCAISLEGTSGLNIEPHLVWCKSFVGLSSGPCLFNLLPGAIYWLWSLWTFLGILIIISINLLILLFWGLVIQNPHPQIPHSPPYTRQHSTTVQYFHFSQATLFWILLDRSGWKFFMWQKHISSDLRLWHTLYLF